MIEISTSSVSSNSVVGGAFTKAGPAPFSGDILQNPHLVWTEDEWNEEREAEALKRLAAQGTPTISEFWKNKYETKGGKYWHDFYKRNTDKFYKDRHYMHIEFPVIMQQPHPDSPNESVRLLEVGCGVGNAALPLLELNPALDVTAIDFAKSAIEILNKNPILLRNPHRMRASQCDIISDDIPVPNKSLDLVLCMFVLSAVPPHNLITVLGKLTAALKPGGRLLVRDYGRYDEAQLRFAKTSKLDENFYVRQDGTCSYFFDLDEFTAACAKCGLVDEDARYIRRQYANREQKVARYRVWINGTYIKKEEVVHT